MKSEIFKIQNTEIEYHFRNKTGKQSLIFLHGMGANHEQFMQQIEFFSQNYQVVSLNVRGHGDSKSTDIFSLAACAQDLIDLLDHLHIDKFHFVGNSMGGNIGYELLKSFESRLLSMTTFGTTAELNTSESLTKTLTTTYKFIPISMIAALASSVGQTKHAKQVIRSMMKNMKRETILEIIPSLAKFNYLNVISNSNTPFMIIKGTKDSDINKELLSTLAALEQRGNFTLVEFENAGHFTNLDDPEKFNSTLSSFLSTRP